MSKRLNIEYIRSEFEKEGYILLTETYENNTQKLDYICPKGHRHSIIWNNWQGGKRCFYCCGTVKLNIEFIRAEFAKEGYTLLTEVYENSRQRLKYICPKGHKHKISWCGWRGGNRCPFCANKAKLTIDFIRAEFAKEGYILLTTEYRNAHQKLDYICLKGHRHAITWNSWQRGRRCPVCPSKVSKWEFEVKKFIDSLNIDYISNDRTQLVNPNTNHNLELDIWFPQLSKAIECNGSYWHSIENASKRDKIKSMLCKKRNINLLVLDDIEWAEDKPFCKHKVRNFITIKEAK
jgi:hypothetical protein